MEEKETALLQSSTDALQLRQENQALKQVYMYMHWGFSLIYAQGHPSSAKSSEEW